MHSLKGIWYNYFHQGTRELVILFILAIYPLLVLPNAMDPITIPRFWILVAFSTIGLLTLFTRKITLPRSVWIPLSLFGLMGMVSTLLAPNQYTAWLGLSGPIAAVVDSDSGPLLLFNRFYRHTGFITYLSCIILFLIATKSNRPLQLIKWLISSASIISIIAIGQFFGWSFIYHGGVAAGTMGNPNFLGTYSVFILPVSILFFLKYKTAAWLTSTALIYSALLVSLTRGAWLAFGLALTIICISCLKLKNIRHSLALLLIVLILVTTGLFSARDGIIMKRALGIGYELESAIALEDEAGSSRFYIWKETIKILPDYWVFGMGPDHLVEGNIFVNQRTIVDKAHNNFLEIAITMGIFSLLFYLAFLSNFISRWDTETERIFSLMILTYLVQGLFNIEVVMIMPLFWIVLGLSIANRKVSVAKAYGT